jgi:hypothetical protein
MLDVYTILSNIIEPIVPCFVGHYPTDQLDENGNVIPKVYPYAEIKFPNILPNNSFSDNNLLEVDIWDNKDTDITEIESICDSIHKALNKYHYNDGNMDISINRNSPYKLELPDSLLNIQRRQLRYIVRVYYK